MTDTDCSAPSPATALQPANAGRFGLLSAADFALTTGKDKGCTSSPQALWFFRHESIAVPRPGNPVAGFARSKRVAADIADWHAETPLGSTLDAPPLVWVGAEHVGNGLHMPDPTQLTGNGTVLPMALAPRHPLNRAYFDELSAAFFRQRSVRVRGTWQDGCLLARTLWPEDFCLSTRPRIRPLATTTPEALRERVREQPFGGTTAPFTTELLWQRPGALPWREDSPVLAFILNGAQGDDDEAHGGHFAPAIGRIGPNGGMHDWLVANYYSLDAESEKGILAAEVPLDNYLADLNSGQAWYRPSCMLVAVLRSPHAAAHVQSALGRVFNQFYRHQFSYQHARANCAGISVDTLRALGWAIPATGAESWLKAIIALPAVTLGSGSLKQGKAAFDYLTEDGTRLFPALAFEQVGTDLLRLAQGALSRPLSAFEAALAKDIESLLFVRIPQLPSSRAWGDFPVASNAEYKRRLPKDPAHRQIVPVGPRPFPRDFIDPLSPRELPLRSDYAVAAYALALAGLGAWLIA